jgi:polar amino acid transport system substrate-binding protein
MRAVVVATALKAGISQAAGVKHSAAPQPSSSPPLPLATGTGYPPYADLGLPGKGLSPRLIERVMAAAGIPYTLTVLPWNRVEQETRAGVFAGMFPYIKSPERQAAFYFSDVIHVEDAYLFVPAASRLRVRSLADLAGKTLCKPLGYALEASLQPLVAAKKVKVERPPSMRLCFRMLKAGRVDALTEGGAIFWQTLARFDGEFTPADFKALSLVVQRTTLHFLASKKHPRGLELIRAFNAALAASPPQAPSSRPSPPQAQPHGSPSASAPSRP